MTRPPALEELLAPPVATTGAFESRQAVEDMADALLQRLRQEEQDATEALPTPSSAPHEDLTPEACDALYAWGVVCYTAGRHDDAAALFGALARRQPPTLRLWRALGANHLARGDGARAAEAFAQVSRLSPEDAEALFFRAEAECLRSRRAEARALLQEAARLARAHPSKWPGLKAWCDELSAQTQDPPCAES